MAHTLQAKLKEPEADENKRGPRPQDLIRLYDIILQVNVLLSSVSKLCGSIEKAKALGVQPDVCVTTVT